MSPVPRFKRSGLAIVAALVVTALLPAGALARGGDGDPCAAPAPASGTPLAGGATTLTLDAGFAKALADNGVAAAPVAPATANEDGSIAFPITGGSLGDAVDITAPRSTTPATIRVSRSSASGSWEEDVDTRRD